MSDNKANAESDLAMTSEERIKLSYAIFSSHHFREWLLCDPTAAAADLNIDLPATERAELLKYKDKLRTWGRAIDALVSLGKDVNILWQDSNLGILGVNGISDCDDYNAAFKARKD